ncbi:disease resistance protein RPS6-like [Neltuma alba]|uniref:disease resistance protein RPS6-like n=1 Tax=Neltuma alba TaxID=207710 RepID=UPI0010A32B93|nr:disease resistance protein RPS6-like [Prosopis alba]
MPDVLKMLRRDIFLPTDFYDTLLLDASKECLHMHDLLQEMGRSIVLQESPGDASRRSRLWVLEDIDLVLKGNRGTENIQTISLDPQQEFEAEWHPDCFSRMRNLRLLNLSKVRLLHNLNSLPSALKFLTWDHYALESLPSFDQLYELECLQLCNSKITKLWNGAPSLGKLRIIDLSDSDDLIETPDFSATPNLEELVLTHCSNLVRIHESVGQLKKLVKLRVGY